MGKVKKHGEGRLEVRRGMGKEKEERGRNDHQS